MEQARDMRLYKDDIRLTLVLRFVITGNGGYFVLLTRLNKAPRIRLGDMLPRLSVP